MVIERCLMHLAKVIIVNTEVLVCLHLCTQILIEPSQLQELLKAISGFEMQLLDAIHVAQLFVSDHLVAIHLLLLALVLQLTEHSQRSV